MVWVGDDGAFRAHRTPSQPSGKFDGRIACPGITEAKASAGQPAIAEDDVIPCHEALLWEGGGEDYLTVVFQAEEEPAPVHKTRGVTPIPASALACYADPDGVMPTATLQSQRAVHQLQPP